MADHLLRPATVSAGVTHGGGSRHGGVTMDDEVNIGSRMSRVRRCQRPAEDEVRPLAADAVAEYERRRPVGVARRAVPVLKRTRARNQSPVAAAPRPSPACTCTSTGRGTTRAACSRAAGLRTYTRAACARRAPPQTSRPAGAPIYAPSRRRRGAGFGSARRRACCRASTRIGRHVLVCTSPSPTNQLSRMFGTMSGGNSDVGGFQRISSASAASEPRYVACGSARPAAAWARSTGRSDQPIASHSSSSDDISPEVPSQLAPSRATRLRVTYATPARMKAQIAGIGAAPQPTRRTVIVVDGRGAFTGRADAAALGGGDRLGASGPARRGAAYRTRRTAGPPTSAPGCSARCRPRSRCGARSRTAATGRVGGRSRRRTARQLGARRGGRPAGPALRARDSGAARGLLSFLRALAQAPAAPTARRRRRPARRRRGCGAARRA